LDIAVIGAGVVGQATGKGFARLGHNVHFYDFNDAVVKKLQNEGYSASDHKLAVKEPKIYHVVFICVPEAHIDQKELELWQKGYGADVWVIRSTVPVGTTRKLINHPVNHSWMQVGTHALNQCVCHNPEFLREAVAEYEFMNPDKIIIGECCEYAGEILEQLYKPFNVPIIRTNPETSELVKLVSNGYLAAQISFWNQVKLIADKLGVNSHVVGKACALDPRISEYGASLHGKPYGGKCLPKDLAQLKLVAMEKGVTSYFLDAVKEINDWLKVKK
jgi:UDPglucose 6-dehydrogenase